MSLTPAFLPSSARTTSGTSNPVAVPASVDTISVLVSVSASGGTGPNLALSVQWSNDGGTTWADSDPADTFTAITASPKVVVKSFTVRAAMMRLSWAITGTTPSFTFSADARWADHT